MHVYHIQDAECGPVIYVRPEGETFEQMMAKLGTCSVLELKATISTKNAFHIQVRSSVNTWVTT